MSAAPPRQDVRKVIEESLTQIRKAAPRQSLIAAGPLQEACKAAEEKLKANGAGSAPALGPEACLQVYKQACELEGYPNVVCLALNAIQRLMPLGYFVGPATEEAPSAPPAANANEADAALAAPRLIIDNVIDVICSCQEQARDDVQLRLVQAIAVALTSPVCEVHGKSLIKAVSTCFKVYKNSTNQQNQAIAKAKLTQVVGLLTQIAMNAASSSSTPEPASNASVVSGKQSEAAKAELASWVMVPNPSEKSRSEWVASYLDSLIEQVVATSAKEGALPDASEAPQFISLPLRDALQVLLSFSKQLAKDPIPGQVERQFLRSKRISLDMVYHMLETADQRFVSSPNCARILRQTLFPALIKNTLSPLPDVFDLSLKTFSLLVSKTRRSLKREIGVFVTQILLPTLSSGNSTYQIKLAVLQTIKRMCEDAAVVIELFMNFDCDMESDNILEIIAERLSQIAQGKYAASEHTSLIDPQQENELKILALKTLKTLAGSLADWAYRIPEGSPDAHDRLAIIMERRKRKLALKRAVEKFNMKPKKGVAELKEAGFITDEPASLASLIRKENTGLDKTEVGDFIGENKPYNMSVLQALVDSQDFKNLGVDHALRDLISSFRLPGEAQKIDRVIDIFSKKYFHDNPGVFANSDTAHILAFSVIMLQTDLHSDQIKNKMTKASFISNNRGIDDGKDLPREYLETLYDTVLENPFSLKEDDDARQRLASQQAQTATQKLQLWLKETEEIYSNALSILRQPLETQVSEVNYWAARTADHASPTFSVACWPLLAAFTTVLQDVDEQSEVSLMETSVEGLRLCARVAARFDMHTKRDAVVSAIAMFTYLMTLKEIRQKNIECIKALMNIALSDGGRLGASWQHVLQCLSRLEQLQLISDKARPDGYYFNADAGVVASNASLHSTVSGRSVGAAGITTLLSTGLTDDQVEQANSQSVMSQIEGLAQLIDRLFLKTSSLDYTSIVGFVVQLVRVSREELATPDKPRVFSLHKLVEVADYNMDRPSDVWAQIWEPLSQHLVEVASHPNANVSMYAVDSLRQLANSFLGKDDASASSELRASVLRPFEVMMFSTRSMSPEVKSYVVDALLYIVQYRTHRIKSGWKVVLRILAAVSRALVDEEGIQRGFTAITAGLRHQVLFEEHFQETVDTIYAFATCQSSVAASLEAIKCLHQAADYKCLFAAAEKVQAVTPGGTEKTAQGTVFFRILKCLADSISDPRKDVRKAALETLFEILCQHSGFVGGSGWEIVMTDIIEQVFKGLHDRVKAGGTDPDAETSASLYLAAVKDLTRLIEESIEAWPASALLRAMALLQQTATNMVDRAAVAAAASECVRKLAGLAAERKGLSVDPVSLLKAANKEMSQNGGDTPSEISTTAESLR